MQTPPQNLEQIRERLREMNDLELPSQTNHARNLPGSPHCMTERRSMSGKGSFAWSTKPAITLF